VARARRARTGVERRSLEPSNQEDSMSVAAGGDVHHQPGKGGAGVSRYRACGERRRAIGERGTGVPRRAAGQGHLLPPRGLGLSGK